jgi:predicted phosphohydrolase
MTIWAIADLHASAPDPNTGRPAKPMDLFGPNWTDHMDRLESAWEDAVASRDTVVIAGDIDWALHLEGALFTLERLDRWKGSKLLIRGNHDYWWSSKTTNKVRRTLPESIRLIHNDSVVAEGVNVCGTKGSPVPGGIDWTPENEKLLARELHRLQLSLDSRVASLPTIVALHFPPFYPGFGTSPYRDTLHESGIQCCVYGHLHGDAAVSGPTGWYDGVDYRLVAGDYVDFCPIPVWDGGVIAAKHHAPAR